ncbi:MAG TPA: oligosaccharide flippase family protein [Solirubrobacteraceae bacterium]|nr:oligosaccharide flippase family protein [Solirubrobacteraceae bacterium]
MPARADDGDSIGRGSAPLFWAQVVGNAGLLVAVVPIARELGPTGRGTVAFITVTAIIAATLARLGVTEATTVFCARRPAQRPALLTNLLLSVSIAALVAAVVVCGTLELVPRLRPPGIGDVELAVLAGAMFASGLADAGYMFVLGCSRFRLHALVTATAAWLYAGTMWLLAVTGEITVVHATLIWAAAQAAKAAVLLLASVRAEGLGRPEPRLLRESLAFGVRAWIGTLSTAFNDRLDQILVALLASEAVLGIYATAVNAFDVLLYLAAAAATAIVPLVARADPALRTGRVLAAFRAVALVTAIGIALAAATGPELIRLVFGAGFHDSAAPFLWLLPGALGFAALSIFSSALVGSSAPGRSSAGPFVSLVLGIALDFLLVPPLGASGAAIAASAGLVAGGAVALVLYRRLSAFPLRALVVPEVGDADLLRALAQPLRGR